ncbi:MAG: YajQ family cyclic di-GMP-binding protein [Deltaproteobacteria bacterium]|nr:YajQ family cyclic di-GMP-binding protein [Deltaproteobacteria bacterium]
MPSFDIVSKLDMQEVDNAVNIAKKELLNRFDFKGSKSTIELGKEEITLVADEEFKLTQLKEILENKVTKRGISLLALDYQKLEDATLGTVRQKIKLKSGVDKDNGRKIISAIKDTKLKVQAQMMDDVVRVTAKKIDDLQAVMGVLKAQTEIPLPLQFQNMRP